MTINTEQFITVNVGLSEDDGTGDALRTAFIKLNQNFGNITATGFNSGNIIGNANGSSPHTISGFDAVIGNLTLLGTTTFNSNAYVKIPGGAPNQVLQTDGAGNLSWFTPAGVGTINGSFTANLAYYASTGDTLSGTGVGLQWNGSSLLIQNEIAATLADATALSIALGG